MKIQVQEHVDISPMTTFALPATVRYFVSAENSDDVRAAYQYARDRQVPVCILGGGSNIVFAGDAVLDCLMLKNEIRGIRLVTEDETSAVVEIGAGEVWDDAVAYTVAHGLSGIEALSGIPGTSGATPIQNVGAYGQEIKNVLVSVETYDIEHDRTVTLTNAACLFSYRDSYFKHEGKGKYVIVGITLRLSKQPPTIPNYPDVVKYFAEREITAPTLTEIRNAILEIRQIKLPLPSSIPSVGSFFKNPIVTVATFEHLKKEYPTIPAYPAGEGLFKLSAGWLIESLGLKGKSFGTLGLYHKNAIVMVNNGGATYTDVCKLRDHVVGEVEKVYGVKLEPEPVFIQ